MKRNSLPLTIGAFAILSLAITACQKEGALTQSSEELATSAFKSSNNDPQNLTFYALSNNTLDKFSTSAPEMVISSTPITGLGSATIVAIDFRPSNSLLYGLGNNNIIYQIDPATGAATAKPALFTTENKMPPVDANTTRIPVTVSGALFGFDFNPAADRLRIVSNTGQSLRINVETGFTIIDGSINPQPAAITSVAYDNNDNDPMTPTELYAIDVMSQKLFEVDPPNNGTLVEEGALNLKVTGEGGFDIAPRNAAVTTDIGLGLYEVNNKSTLFRVDVETGETKILAKYSKGVAYSAIAISPFAN